MLSAVTCFILCKYIHATIAKFVAWDQSIIVCSLSQLNNAKKDARHRARLRLHGLRTTKSVTLSNVHPIERVYIPLNFECALLKNRNSKCSHLYLSSELYVICVPFSTRESAVWYDGESRMFSLYRARSNSFVLLFHKFVSLIISSTSKLFFHKIKFKGKGYKIARSKERKTLSFQFGHSHKILEYTFLISVRAILKQALILYGINALDLKRIAEQIRRGRPINIYTGRGIRFSRQVIYRKQGKVKTYK